MKMHRSKSKIVFSAVSAHRNPDIVRWMTGCCKKVFIYKTIAPVKTCEPSNEKIAGKQL